MKKIILFISITISFQGLSQSILSMPNNAFLSHNSLMNKVLNRPPEKGTNPAKELIFNGNKNLQFHKNAKKLGTNAYCNCQTPLAIQSIELKVSRINNEIVKIEWKTTGEHNSQGFEMERSTDGTKFLKREFIAAKNISETKNEYEFDDKNSFENPSFYRIKETDLNGKITYSKVAVVAGINSETEFIVSPNPAIDNFVIGHNSKTADYYNINLYSASGKQVISKKVSMEKGENNHKIYISDLPIGTYFLLISNNKIKTIKKLVKN